MIRRSLAGATALALTLSPLAAVAQIGRPQMAAPGSTIQPDLRGQGCLVQTVGSPPTYAAGSQQEPGCYPDGSQAVGGSAGALSQGVGLPDVRTVRVTQADGADLISAATLTGSPATVAQGTATAVTLNAAGQAFNLETTGFSTLSFQAVAAASSSVQIDYQVSNDGQTWTSQYVWLNGAFVYQPTVTSVFAGQYVAQTSGRYMRVRVLGTPTGSITLWGVLKAGNAQLFGQSTQGVAFVGTQNVQLQSGSNAIGSLTAGTANIGFVTPSPTTSATGAVAPVTTATSIATGKASAGNLYSASLTEGATAGFLVLENVATPTTAAASFTAVIECIPVPANGYYHFAPQGELPYRFTAGIQAYSSSSCTTYTAVTPLRLTVAYQ